MALFTNEAAVILAGETPLIILSVTVLFQIVQVIIVGSLRRGRRQFVALLMFVSVTIVRPVLTWVLCYPLNLRLAGAWLSVFLDQFTRYIVSYWRFRGEVDADSSVEISGWNSRIPSFLTAGFQGNCKV